MPPTQEKIDVLKTKYKDHTENLHFGPTSTSNSSKGSLHG